mmetsp:Transcript_3998/g.7258  ORF Transcript_3998/g.7258 Transcript_3998/m.7258 type:complete len:354 (-) Transcript_3998:226-1287(-)
MPLWWALIFGQGFLTCSQIIVDADMNVDDMAAIAYLLGRGADIRAVTVSATGFSAQWAGVDNALRLLYSLNRSDIPVAFQDGYLSSTQLNLKYPRGMPPAEWLEGTNNYLTQWVKLPASPVPPAWQCASQLIIQVLRSVPDKSMHLLELGPYTNIAAAMHRDGGLFQSKVKAVYVQGGKIQASSPGQEPAPHGVLRGVGFPWTTKTKPSSASWNVFLDAIAAAQVFALGLPTVLMADSAFELLGVRPEDPGEFRPANCTNQVLEDIMLNWAPAHGEQWSDLRYWDQGTAIMMMQLLNGYDSCKHWLTANITISLQNDGSYATYLQGLPGAPTKACLQSPRASLLEEFYSAGCG